MKKLVFFFTLAIISQILTSTAFADEATQGHYRVQVSGDFNNTNDISFSTPEGIHSFSLKKVDADKYLDLQDEQDAFFFKAVHKRRVIGDVNPYAAVEIIDGVMKLNFFGRRTGRAYLLTVSMNRKSAPFIGKLSFVSKNFSSECATLDAHNVSESESKEPVVQAVSRELTLSVDADFHFFKKYKTKGVSSKKAVKKSKNSIRSIINQVNSIYSQQLGISITINSLDVDSLNKRTIKSNNSNNVLEAFRYYTSKSKLAVRSDIYHLFTNNSLSGSVVGLAYVGSTCRTSLGNYAFGLSKLTNPAVQSLVTAHELAHNLGATHIDGTSSIMSPYLTPGKNQFISASISQIFGFIQQYGACLASVQ